MKRLSAIATGFLVFVAAATSSSFVLAQDAAAPDAEVAADDAADEDADSAPPEEAADEADAGGAAEAGSETPEEEAVEAAPMDGETYRVRLRDLEQRVDELKEQIRRSHTRLSLLSDTILAGASGGGRAEIEFVNDLSGAWHVIEAVFVLDGSVQYKKSDDTGVLAKQKTIPIFSGAVPTGDHTLQVMLKLRGHGFGVFSYLRGIEATVKSSHSFTLSDGKVLQLKATAWEKGGPTTPVEQQPNIRFNSTIRSLADMPKAAPASSAPAAEGEAEGSVSPRGGGGSLNVGGGGSSSGAASDE